MNTDLSSHLSARSKPSRRNFSRRQFFGAITAAGVTAALGDVLVTDAPWLDYNEQVRQTWNAPFKAGADMPARIREMIHSATLAASTTLPPCTPPTLAFS